MAADVTHAMLVACAKKHTLTKAEAGYVDSPTAKTCGTCEYFKGPYKCTILKTVVDPATGCCDLWKE